MRKRYIPGGRNYIMNLFKAFHTRSGAHPNHISGELNDFLS